ncbi:MAG: nucleoside triphosphate pyrophosphohydrolase [Gammaproteobacteria bacterium]|nr:nucleoside triphosphate pyrophosphohydrolase [Gammaproteobacteria bacterium]
MSRLRNPDSGCPWDLEQGFESLVPHMLEEAYEVAETIETGRLHELNGELGDLLFQVVFYARLAEEQGRFGFEDVVEGIVHKLISRHPHVFGGDTPITTARQQSEAWEAHKARERGGAGALAGVATSLPAMTRAMKLQKRAARVGYQWPDVGPAFDKILEELEEVRVEIEQKNARERVEDEMGDLLFACVNLSRMAGIDPETALRCSNRKFERRFAHMEATVDTEASDLTALSLAEWEGLWERAKADEQAI